jgi:hypothetical protein
VTVVPLRKFQSAPAEPRKLIVSRIDGHREWSSGGAYEMIAASDGSVELISPRKTLRVADGKRLAATLGRYAMEPWTDGDFSARWVYGLADGGPPDYGGGSAGHWLWIDIGTGVIPKHFDRDGNQTNPGAAGKPAIDHIVMANSSAAYHGKKLREALRRLA